jgi:hypothetical protein
VLREALNACTAPSNVTRRTAEARTSQQILLTAVAVDAVAGVVAPDVGWAAVARWRLR